MPKGARLGSQLTLAATFRPSKQTRSSVDMSQRKQLKGREDNQDASEKENSHVCGGFFIAYQWLCNIDQMGHGSDPHREQHS